jgi:hypothetical protein
VWFTASSAATSSRSLRSRRLSAPSAVTCIRLQASPICSQAGCGLGGKFIPPRYPPANRGRGNVRSLGGSLHRSGRQPWHPKA